MIQAGLARRSTNSSMPDWTGDSDDDETLEPFFNDTGEFGDNQGDDENDETD